MASATLLIVDDDELLRHSFRERFVHEGYDLVEAGSVSDALERFAPEVDLMHRRFKSQVTAGACRGESRVDVRVRPIARDEVKAGKFREDLFYRFR